MRQTRMLLPPNLLAMARPSACRLRIAGVDPEEAHRDARREMGGVDQVIQHVRDVRAGVWLDRLVQDVQYGVRTLAKNPASTRLARKLSGCDNRLKT
jgi:hypothetical protein